MNSINFDFTYLFTLDRNQPFIDQTNPYSNTATSSQQNGYIDMLDEAQACPEIEMVDAYPADVSSFEIDDFSGYPEEMLWEPQYPLFPTGSIPMSIDGPFDFNLEDSSIMPVPPINKSLCWPAHQVNKILRLHRFRGAFARSQKGPRSASPPFGAVLKKRKKGLKRPREYPHRRKCRLNIESYQIHRWHLMGRRRHGLANRRGGCRQTN